MTVQIALGPSTAKPDIPLWTEPFVIPVYFVGLSVIILALQLWDTEPIRRKIHDVFRFREYDPILSEGRLPKVDSNGATSAQPENAVHNSSLLGAQQNVKEQGTYTSALKLLRALSCFVLLAITILALIQCGEQEAREGTPISTMKKLWHICEKHKERCEGTTFRRAEWIEVALCTFFSYASLLSLLSLILRRTARHAVTTHLILLLLAVFSIYVYRDLWPLATYTLHPADAANGWFTWSRIGILGFASVFVPLVTPREYIPLDPKSTLGPVPEQTASPLSFMFYSFLDPIVFAAYKTPHLPYDQLPPLADRDHSSYLRAISFPKLDPVLRAKATPRHIVFGLIELLGADYLVMTSLMFVRVIFVSVSPIGVNRLLNYMETGGEGAVVRPWVWVLLLLFSPLFASMSIQTYGFFVSRVMVRVEGVLTQLIFEHSLRIRMKEGMPSNPEVSGTVDHSVALEPPTHGDTEASDSNARTAGEADGSLPASQAVEASEPVAPPTSAAATGVPPTKTAASETSSDKSKDSNLVGKLNNLISSDLDNITEGRDFLFLIFHTPLQILLCIWFLYVILGWSAFVGLAVILLSFPLPGKIAQLNHTVQVERMKKTDERVQSVTENIQVLRMIKLFGWESRIEQLIKAKREIELRWLQKKFFLQLLNMDFNFVLPLMTMLATFVTYTVVMGNALSAAKISQFSSPQVFSSLTVFDLLRSQLHFAVMLVPITIQSKVSLDRVNEFLNDTELLDRHEDNNIDEEVTAEFEVPSADLNVIGFHNAAFTWSRSQSDTLPMIASYRNFRLRIAGDLFFRREGINLIVGPTGSGKTSLLLALLGELHFSPPGPDSWFNLPREEGVAFAAQEPWILNETIKDNILFGQSFDSERYLKVLDQCALNRDLAMLDAGDETEVGEKGLTLSGGQKARIGLARAVYSKAKIVLLDDVLSALDVHTIRWVVDKCFNGDLLKGRTIILVTHNIAVAAPIARFVVSISSDGVVSHGTVEEILSHDRTLALEMLKGNEAVEKAEQVSDDKSPKQDGDKPSGKLITDEEIALGHVSRASLLLYFSNMGNWSFWLSSLGARTVSDGLFIVQMWYLGLWASQYELYPPEAVHAVHYIGYYSLIILVTVIVYSAGYLAYTYGSIRASRRIHEKLVRSLLRTTLRFLDKTPVGRIISRFTRDVRAVDGPLNAAALEWFQLTIPILLKLFTLVYMTPAFLVPSLAFVLIGGILGQIYMKAQLSIKREMSNSRSPLFSHFAAAMSGLITIRAYGAEEQFKAESLRRIDKYSRPARAFYNMNRWMGLRTDGLGALFSAGLAAYLVYVQPNSNASNTGFQISQAVSLTGMLLWWVRFTNDLEVQGNSLERIEGYLTIEQEPPTTESGKPPAYWPSTGNLSVNALSARYAPEGPDTLHELSFDIKSGEKIGVVGRTGAGKSSLTLSLLRLIPTSGEVVFDGLPTSSINLEALRGAITIIPQQPELLSGTIRDNLDPFNQHDDATLNSALRSAGLFSLQADIPENERISLDSMVGSGGGNFSVGQRQILALARALVRKSKLLILDEATASLDHRTDSLIQNSLSTEFKDCTLITVAHRLQTIMNADKILVLDAGRLVEFDSPSNLLKKEQGAFKSLVDESSDKDVLYKLATLG